MEIPYDSIDMDFMNENQSAHGDREYGHIVTRMGIERKVADHLVSKQSGLPDQLIGQDAGFIDFS